MNKLLLIGLMSIVFPVQADVYKCVDTGGKTVYQQTPCEKANLKTVKKLEKSVDPSPEAIQQAVEKSQADIKAYNQRHSERKKAVQEAPAKEQEAPIQENGQQDEHNNSRPIEE